MARKRRARSRQPGERQRRRCAIGIFFLACGFWLLVSVPASAQPTQEEVFRSIGDNVGQPVDSSRLVAVLAGIAGAVALVAVVGQWRGRDRRPGGLNHHGRLMKEVLRNVPLKGAELRQLKSLAGEGAAGGKVESPLTLLLCPSLLAEAAKQSRGKADLPVVAGLIKKLGGCR